MAFSMAACIGLAVWFGRKWDESTQSEVPYGTLLGGVLGTGLAIWMVIRDLSR
ncbi:MAG: AtpZ/AtpI family protein [Flavobacteriales bacterium]|nr:AtpZ/AtpI family protein [Flavobacteriales bacterium]